MRRRAATTPGRWLDRAGARPPWPAAELLVHTDDAARGLGTRLDAPRPLAAAVLTRLFPGQEPGADPWQTLLWAHDRPSTVTLPGPGGWRWHPAPLS